MLMSSLTVLDGIYVVLAATALLVLRAVQTRLPRSTQGLLAWRLAVSFSMADAVLPWLSSQPAFLVAPLNVWMSALDFGLKLAVLVTGIRIMQHQVQQSWSLARAIVLAVLGFVIHAGLLAALPLEQTPYLCLWGFQPVLAYAAWTAWQGARHGMLPVWLPAPWLAMMATLAGLSVLQGRWWTWPPEWVLRSGWMIFLTLGLSMGLYLLGWTLREQAFGMRHRDELTHVLNPNGIQEAWSMVLSFIRRVGQRVSVVILCIDGSAATPSLQKSLAQRLREQWPGLDLIGRLDEQHWVVILPGYDANTALHIVERLRYAWSREPHQLDGRWIRTTLSVGVSSASAAKLNWPDLQVAARKALRVAQAEGGDRCVFQEVLPDIEATEYEELRT